MARPATGSMRERSPGKWELRVTLASDPVTGKRGSLSRTFLGDESAARLQLEELLRRHGGRPIDDGPATLDELFDIWVVAPTRSGVQRSASTIYRETRRYRRHVKPVLGDVAPSDIEPATVRELYEHLDRSGASAKSIAHIHHLLHAVFHWGVHKGHVDASPMTAIDAPAVNASASPMLDADAEVIEEVLRAAESENPELLLLVRLSAVTGASRSELVALRWSTVDLDNATVAFESRELVVPSRAPRRPTRVGAAVEGEPRVVAIDRKTVELLASQREQQLAVAASRGVSIATDGYVLAASVDGTKPRHPDTLSAWMRKLATRVEGAEQLTLSAIRAFVASQIEHVDHLAHAAHLRHGGEVAVA